MSIVAGFQSLASLTGLASLLVLSLLELVLGIDNIIFISLIIAKLSQENRLAARVAGLSLALVMRLIMLFGLVWLSQITTILFAISSFNVTVRDILFFAGGAYLAWSTFNELQEHFKGKANKDGMGTKTQLQFRNAILQIVVADMLFSFDSIFTAIGLIQNFVIMAIAVVIGMMFMVYLSGRIAAFINRYPSVKTLALTFIMGVALLLVLSAFHIEIPKIYFYSAFAIALVAVLVKIKLRKNKR